MAQGNLKLNKSKSQTKPKNAHKSAKEASITKKGKRVVPPKKRNEVEHKVTMKKLSSSINNNIEKQMVDKAQSGPLHLMKNSIQNNEQKNKSQ